MGKFPGIKLHLYTFYSSDSTKYWCYRLSFWIVHAAFENVGHFLQYLLTDYFIRTKESLTSLTSLFIIIYGCLFDFWSVKPSKFTSTLSFVLKWLPRVRRKISYTKLQSQLKRAAQDLHSSFPLSRRTVLKLRGDL